MSFSVGILYSAQNFLKLVNETKINEIEFSSSFNRYQLTSSQQILEVAEGCNWIKLDLEGNLTVSKKGKEILAQKNMLYALRVQLKHLIDRIKPSWSYLIHKGRKEAYQYFPSDVKQCFKEAELINTYNQEVIKWWDILALTARGRQQDTQLEIGRVGEELTLKYEENRVRENPIWQSIESNLSGYDILSKVSSQDSTPLMIEVKASTNFNDSFTFYLTRNEWNVAKISKNYHFHLWLLGNVPELFILDKMKISKHIPINKGNGFWENVKITLSLDDLSEMDIRNDC